ncbi:hypothetical protein AgCh_024748 [Apium graveolens]
MGLPQNELKEKAGRPSSMGLGGADSQMDFQYGSRGSQMTQSGGRIDRHAQQAQQVVSEPWLKRSITISRGLQNGPRKRQMGLPQNGLKEKAGGPCSMGLGGADSQMDFQYGSRGSQMTQSGGRIDRIAQQLFDFVGKSVSDESFKQWEGLIELLGSQSKAAGGLDFLHK